MNSLPDGYRALIFGATGGIGSAFIQHLQNDSRCAEVVGLSRSTYPAIDFFDEPSLADAATMLADKAPFHLIIDATGILSDTEMQPEKALKDITSENFIKSFTVNALGPALLYRYFSPLLPREGKSVFATLSARVGSIGDNQLGGWYAYRAAKAALNMVVRNTAIELGRKYKDAVIVGLHPGTVETSLSDAFRATVKHEIFSPEKATGLLLSQLNRLDAGQTGHIFDYDGEVIPF